MKTKLALVLSALFSASCANLQKLPTVNADSFVYNRTDPFGGTSITAEKVSSDADGVRADKVSWSTQYPFVSFHLTVTGYKQGPAKTK